MTEQEVTVALRNATHEQRQAVFEILRQVELPSTTPTIVQRLYEVAGEVLGTKVGFNTRHGAQLTARIFVTAAYLRAGYSHAQISRWTGIPYQRITYYHRTIDDWRCLPGYVLLCTKLDQFLDIVTKKHIL